MTKQKKQHIIPNCYLKAWCDPNIPSGQSAFIWRVPKDGGKSFRRSPEKSFTSTDRYTIQLPNGERDLTLEDTLADLESKFVQIRDRIKRRDKLTDTDRANLCLFTAGMHGRTYDAGEHWRKTQQRVHDVVVDLEHAHGSTPKTSLETAALLAIAPQHRLILGLKHEAPIYFQMEMTFMVADDPIGFITSDSPCSWYNPKAHTLPPFYRSPGLAHKDIEVTMPITPQIIMLISHHKFEPYMPVGSFFVDQVNHRTRAFADKEFVSWKGKTKPEWFVPYEMPPDSWENTETGKRALHERAERERMFDQKDHREES